ncbi:VirB4 family type IV secretion system protein [Shimazuella kribbensis]|uniref:VirB4 family type IV secretion system protein n=1 Tax=Shimazuella kribbensis TaxID=139808 RepID=UPI0004911493|nr:hypothetical protein [Shimazuella kribbensis]
MTISIRSWFGLTSKSEKENELAKEFPILDVQKFFVQTTDGHFKLVLKITDTINSELLSDDEVIKAVEAIQSCLNALNLHQAIQILISSEQIDMEQYFTYLDQKAESAAQDENIYLLERIAGKQSFLKNHAQNARNIHNFYLVLSTNTKNPEDACDELYDTALALIEYLETGGMGMIPADEDEIKKICYEKLNPKSSMIEPYTEHSTLTSILPSAIEDHAGKTIEMDDMYHRFYTFSHFPEEVGAAWLKRVIEVKANLDISILLRPAEKSRFVKSTNRKLIELESKLVGKLPPMYQQKYEKQKESLEKLMEEIQSDTENLFDVSIIMCLKENSLEDLQSAEKRLQTATASSRFRSKKILFQGNQMVWYLLPICFHHQDLESQISWPMQSTLVSSILPFNSSDLNYSEGVLKGMNGRTEGPVIYDRYNNSYFNNPNEVVFGESGSGKSYYLRLDMLRQVTTGTSNRIFVIDPEREYFLPDANRIIFRLGSSFTTNPFHIRSTVVDSDSTDDGSHDIEQYLRRKIAEMMSFFAWICPNLSAIEKGYLSEGIQTAYEQKGLILGANIHSLPAIFPTLSDLVHVLETNVETHNMIATLKPYVFGPYSSMFNGQTNWDMKKKVTVLDIHELSDEVKRPLMDLLLKDIWEEIKISREEKKGLYVDEAWLLADEDNQQTMKFLREIAKRVRKYGGFLTTATQNVDDFLTIGKYGTAIFNNAFIKTFMKMSEKDIEELSRFMSFSEKELRILGKKKEQGHCIHVAAGKRIEMKVKSSPDERKVLGLEESKKISKRQIIEQKLGISPT